MNEANLDKIDFGDVWLFEAYEDFMVVRFDNC